ncbi:MAG: hypothetical protein H7831_17600, partial [Magnetococcus sp. WYHC-3]
AASDKLLPPLMDMLTMRAKVYATAHRLPHIIWDTNQPMAAADLERLARLCERTGLRLVLVDRQPAGQLPDDFFTMPQGDEPRPGLVYRPDPLVALATRTWSRRKGGARS